MRRFGRTSMTRTPGATLQIPDVNILVHAWRAESADHERAKTWLERAIADSDPLGLIDQVAAGAIRVLTQRVPGLGASTGDVLAYVNELRLAPGVVIVGPSRNHWSIFSGLCRDLGATGNMVPDCYIAALALERNASLVSRDKFFGRVPGLTWMDLPGA